MDTQKATLIDVLAQPGTDDESTGTSCKCGCAPCRETCCTLECQVQPRFFCGQLLTDADLTQLLTWAQGKFRLKRYVDGWGIVCGLEVKLDPKYPDHIMVLPGYAIDCCGRDIVLCDPVSFDLSAACPPADCLVPGSRWPKVPTKPATAQPGKQDPAAGMYPAPAKFFPARLYGESKQYNLYLSYQTEETDLQTALRRDVCSQAAACEASRLKESSSLTFQLANSDQSVERERVQALGTEYDQLASTYLQLRDRANPSIKDEKLLTTLFQSFLHKRPLQEFGYVREWINDPDTQFETDLYGILLMLYLDALRAWVRCGCPVCGPDRGVLLGQVSIVAAGGTDSGECRVIFVDDDPHWRRSLRKDSCFPSAPGCTNLLPYLFKSWSDVQPELQVAVLKDRYLSPMDNITLKDLSSQNLDDVLQSRLVTTCIDQEYGPNIQPMVVDLGEPWGQRIVGFRQRAS